MVRTLVSAQPHAVCFDFVVKTRRRKDSFASARVTGSRTNDPTFNRSARSFTRRLHVSQICRFEVRSRRCSLLDLNILRHTRVDTQRIVYVRHNRRAGGRFDTSVVSVRSCVVEHERGRAPMSHQAEAYGDPDEVLRVPHSVQVAGATQAQANSSQVSSKTSLSRPVRIIGRMRHVVSARQS